MMFLGKFQSVAGWFVTAIVLVALGVGVYQIRAPGAPGSNATTQGAPRRIHVFISGKVQGVGFRGFTKEQAEKLKLTGFVRNLRDGRVECVAEGPAGDIAALIVQIKQGPPGARVDKFDSTDETVTGESQEFEVK